MSLFVDVIFALLPLLALLLPAVALIVLYAVLAPSMLNKRATNDVCNTDEAMKNYLYKTALSQEEFLSELEHLPVKRKDKLTCSFYPATMRITFATRKVRTPFMIAVHDRGDHRIVHLLKNELSSPRSNIPYYINPFLIEKLGLEPIDYQTYIDQI